MAGGMIAESIVGERKAGWGTDGQTVNQVGSEGWEWMKKGRMDEERVVAAWIQLLTSSARLTQGCLLVHLCARTLLTRRERGGMLFLFCEIFD